MSRGIEVASDLVGFKEQESKPGWKLNEGIYQLEGISENQIWQIFSSIFSTKSANRTSYKFGFLKALIESVFEAGIDGSISLNDIFERFARIYWSLIVKYNFRFVKNRGMKSIIIVLAWQLVQFFYVIKCLKDHYLKNDLL